MLSFPPVAGGFPVGPVKMPDLSGRTNSCLHATETSDTTTFFNKPYTPLQGTFKHSDFTKPRPYEAHQQGFSDDLFYFLSTDAFASLYNPVIMEIFMTFSILPNIALGMGVILVIQQQDYSVRIPCHNRATAEDLKRRALRGDWNALRAAMSWAS